MTYYCSELHINYHKEFTHWNVNTWLAREMYGTINITAFLHVMLCSLVKTNLHMQHSMFLQTVSKFLTDYVASHSKKW